MTFSHDAGRIRPCAPRGVAGLHNTDPARTRNAIRHTVLPALAALNPQIVAALNRTADVVAADARRLAALDRRTLNVLLVEPRQLDDRARAAVPWATARPHRAQPAHVRHV
ncbi:MAG: hypothetical protein R3A10_03015 [Caldilineaceae bacterium]